MLVSCFECKLYFFSFCFYWEQIHQNAFQKFITINWMGERKWDIWCISMWETKKKERWTMNYSLKFMFLSSTVWHYDNILFLVKPFFMTFFLWCFFFAWWDCIIFRAFDALKYIFDFSSIFLWTLFLILK